MGMIEPAFMMENTTSSGNLMFLERPEIDNIGADVFWRRRRARRGIEIGWAKTDALWAGDNLNATVYLTGAKSTSPSVMAMAATNRASCLAVSPTASGRKAAPTCRSA